MSVTKKYGITEQKKSELDHLTASVQDATYLQAGLQVVVDSLNIKYAEFSSLLSAATTDKDTALSNYNLVKEVVNTIESLTTTVSIAANQTSKAQHSIKATTTHVATLMEQLIFCGDMVDKLVAFIDKKKGLNPLISDELVKVVTIASRDATQAVAATLTALQSCYTALASGAQADDVSQLELQQSNNLLVLIAGDNDNQTKDIKAAALAKTEVKWIYDRTDLVMSAEKTLTADLYALNTQQVVVENRRVKISKLRQSARKLEAAFYKRTSEKHAATPAVELGKGTPKEAAAVAAAEKSLTAAEEVVNRNHANISESEMKLVTEISALETAKKAVEDDLSSLDTAVLQLKADSSQFMKTASQQQNTSLQYLLQSSYTMSVTKYQGALKAETAVTRELDEAKSNLAKATANLASLSAGLTAATAATMAA